MSQIEFYLNVSIVTISEENKLEDIIVTIIEENEVEDSNN